MYVVNFPGQSQVEETITLVEAQARCHAFLSGMSDKDPRAHHGLRIYDDYAGEEIEVEPYDAAWWQKGRGSAHVR